MHCGKALYNNLLWKNWSPQCLPLMIIIGNSFNGVRDRLVRDIREWGSQCLRNWEVTSSVCRPDRTIEREFKRDYGYIAQATSVCEERQLPCPSRLIDVFSDTAVITFPASSLNSLPQSTWAEPPEPQYQHCPDLEIIQRETRSWDRKWTRNGQYSVFYCCNWNKQFLNKWILLQIEDWIL